MTSFRMGSSPPWWMPTPRLSRGRIASICGSFLSSSDSESMAFTNTCSISAFSSPDVKSILASASAYVSHSRLEKENTMTGSYLRSMIILMMRDRSVGPPLPPPCFRAAFFLPPPLETTSSTASSSAEVPRLDMALLKLSSRNRPFSSTTRYTPSPPPGKMKCCSGVGR